MPIKEQPRQIPQNPGIYFFKLGRKILYIGKAGNLRARISSYFLKNNKTAKTLALLKEADGISWDVLSSETEALIRESELIKKQRPKYNILMRDDKQYFYVGFTKEKFPKILISHQPRNFQTQVSWLGPFTEGSALKSVLKTLRRVFPYCTCLRPHKNLCLNARIGRCFGYCCVENTEKLSEDTASVFHYKKNISSIKKILSGKNKTLVKELTKKMEALSDKKEYEEAAKVRNQIAALERIFAHKEAIKRDLPSENIKAIQALESILKISGVERIEAYDIANIHGRFAYGSMSVWENSALNKNEYRLFKIRSLDTSNDPAMIREVLSRRFNHSEWKFPQVVIIDGGRGQLFAALKFKNSFLKQGLPHSNFFALNPPRRFGGSDASQKLEHSQPFFNVCFVALTKNPKHVGDHIFIENFAKPIPLSNLTESLRNLILHLDAEAHRFAIRHYRNLHRKFLIKNNGN
ncbi:GIY-YIG nuclease family protein [Candidatus Giovannonibacteria bacterium]|nr:GIY-YIG nuclease family protein [Candidatus Giovannonibacteria bacterium]